MRVRLVGAVAAVALAVAVVLCANPLHGVCRTEATVDVAVGIPPLAFLVERIGGEHVTVSTLLVAGQDPHTFEPTPRQVVGLTSADLYFSVDLPFEERMLSKVSGSGVGLTIIDTVEEDAGDAEHHLDEVDSHGHSDPHVWLSPAHLQAMARTIASALSANDGEHADEYRQNLQSLLDEIEATDRRIHQKLSGFAGREFLIYHSALGHFAQTYGLVEVAIEVEGKSPGAKALANIIERARSNKIRAVFVQPQFDDSSARLIAEAIGAEVITLDPLKKDVLANLESIAEHLAATMK
jgi:zinc transport system substrate-binding protein